MVMELRYSTPRSSLKGYHLERGLRFFMCDSQGSINSSLSINLKHSDSANGEKKNSKLQLGSFKRTYQRSELRRYEWVTAEPQKIM